MIKAATLITGSECKNPGSRGLSKERPLETSACLPVPPLFVGTGPSLPCSVAAPGAASASPTVQCGSLRPPHDPSREVLTLQRAQTANSGSICTALSLSSQRMHGRGGHGSSAQENQRDRVPRESHHRGLGHIGSKPQGASSPSCLCHVAKPVGLEGTASSQRELFSNLKDFFV